MSSGVDCHHAPVEALVTERESFSRPVTSDVPYAEALARVADHLRNRQAIVNRLQCEMAELCALGICLDEVGAPVIPRWWDRQDRPYRYLLWPAAYARRSGKPRRQYVRPEEQAGWEALRQRTLEYANVKAQHDRLCALIEKTGRALTGLADQPWW